MIELHGLTHGRDYWRDLMRMTLKEILTGPNISRKTSPARDCGGRKASNTMFTWNVEKNGSRECSIFWTRPPRMTFDVQSAVGRHSWKSGDSQIRMSR